MMNGKWPRHPEGSAKPDKNLAYGLGADLRSPTKFTLFLARPAKQDSPQPATPWSFDTVKNFPTLLSHRNLCSTFLAGRICNNKACSDRHHLNLEDGDASLNNVYLCHLPPSYTEVGFLMLCVCMHLSVSA